MSRTLGVVELPGQVFDSRRPVIRSLAGRRFGGRSLVEWVARRVTEVEHIQDVVVLLSSAQQSVQQLAPSDVAVHVSQRDDALGRLAEVSRASGADAVVRVSIDTPFMDPVLVDQLISTAHAGRADYATYRSADGRSAMQSRLGLVGEWCQTSAVIQADRQARSAARHCPTQYLWSHPELFELQFIPVPAPLDRHRLRLAIDSEEDWEQAHEIYEALGPEDLDWQRIALLLASQGAGRPGASRQGQKAAS